MEETDHNSWKGKQRVILVGDAAHAAQPTYGYGVSMAFEDAVVLLQLLIYNSLVIWQYQWC
jgi:2-polyprenyl-6-methoxyphenol hydroxylase-like FAD-dependent oxidoreductase